VIRGASKHFVLRHHGLTTSPSGTRCRDDDDHRTPGPRPIHPAGSLQPTPEVGFRIENSSRRVITTTGIKRTALVRQRQRNDRERSPVWSHSRCHFGEIQLSSRSSSLPSCMSVILLPWGMAVTTGCCGDFERKRLFFVAIQAKSALGRRKSTQPRTRRSDRVENLQHPWSYRPPARFVTDGDGIPGSFTLGDLGRKSISWEKTERPVSMSQLLPQFRVRRKGSGSGPWPRRWSGVFLLVLVAEDPGSGRLCLRGNHLEQPSLLGVKFDHRFGCGPGGEPLFNLLILARRRSRGCIRPAQLAVSRFCADPSRRRR
jgi:hypothetical protein